MENRKYTNLIFILLGAPIFLYVSIRAFHLSFTWDESYTFLEFVRRDFWLHKPKNYMEANNHLLNTWLMKVASAVSGNSEFSLRLPNVLAHLLFLFFSAKILSQFKPGILTITSFLIINLNPFLLDFFSIARGYGLSIGLMMPVIYYLYLYLKNTQLKNALTSLIIAALAVLASLTILNFFLSLTLIIILHNSFGGRPLAFFERKRIIETFLIILVPAALCWYIIPYAIELKQTGSLYYGGETGFWVDTVGSLINSTLYGIPYFFNAKIAIEIFIILILLMSISYVFITIKKKDTNVEDYFLMALLSILIMCYLSSWLQHYLLGTKFSLDRTGLFLIPIFNLIVVFVLKRVSDNFFYFKGLLIFLCAFFLFHFILTFNFRYVLSWKEEANVKEVICLLENQQAINPIKEKSISIGVNLSSESNIKFYRATHHLNWLNLSLRVNSLSFLHKYYLLIEESAKDLDKNSVEVIKTFPNTNNTLYLNKRKPVLIAQLSKQQLLFDGASNNYFKMDSVEIYSKALSFIVKDSIPLDSNSLISFNVMVNANDVKADARVILAIENKAGTYFWSNVSIQDFVQKPNQWTMVNLTAIVPAAIKENDVIKAYLWNIGNKEVCVDNMELKIEKYYFQ